MTTETRVTDWHEFPHSGCTHYRIWQRLDGRIWQQRHEWRHDDGTTTKDTWIIGAGAWCPSAKAA